MQITADVSLFVVFMTFARIFDSPQNKSGRGAVLLLPKKVP